MKFLIGLMFIFGIFAAQASEEGRQLLIQKKLVPVDSIEAFQVPKINLVKLDIKGRLMNTCYSEPFVEIKRNDLSNTVIVKVFSIVSGQNCAEVLKLFEITANLGFFTDGTYDIIVQPDTEWETVDTVLID